MITFEVDGRSPLPESFFDVARLVYKNDPSWIPEDPAGIAKQFSRANPRIVGGLAMVAVEEGKGRIAAFLMHDQVIDDLKVAYFGFFEAINDPDVVDALFAIVEKWALAHGVLRIYGPVNFNTFGAYRIRTQGFEEGAFPGEPYNPPYYQALLEERGYATDDEMQYGSYPIDMEVLLESSKLEYDSLKPHIESTFNVESLTPAIWLDNHDEFYRLIDMAFSRNFAYSGICPDEFKASMGASFAAKICPVSSMIARTHDGKIAGFFLAFPDYSPLVNQSDTEKVVDGFRTDRDFEKLPMPRTMLLKTVGVHPDYRRHGLSIYLGLEGSLRARERYGQVIATLIRDGNHSSNFPKRHTGSPRRYALYSKAL